MLHYYVNNGIPLQFSFDPQTLNYIFTDQEGRKQLRARPTFHEPYPFRL